MSTKLHLVSINEKPFGFKADDYRGKQYLVAREMFNPDPDSAGFENLEDAEKSLRWGKNGINLAVGDDCDSAIVFVRNIITVICELTDKTIEQVIDEILQGDSGG